MKSGIVRWFECSAEHFVCAAAPDMRLRFARSDGAHAIHTLT
jgi:hypothetical protein